MMKQTSRVLGRNLVVEIFHASDKEMEDVYNRVRTLSTKLTFG